MQVGNDAVISANVVRKVQLEDCASRWGNDGLDVLSTPAILGNLEQVCVDALQPYLEQGQMTVGVRVEMHHRAPTPLDDEVEYRITVRTLQPKIEIEFSVVGGAGNVVCSGTHQRAVIDAVAFKRNLAELAGPISGN
jgi:predicted thioesterase